MKDARTPTISVVVPTHMRRARLPLVLEPLLREEATTEVVVVVDGDADGTYADVHRRSLREPRLLPLLTENRGQAAAQQYGAQHARGDVVLFVDDDVVPVSGLVQGHACKHIARNDLVVLGYMPVRSTTKQGATWVVRRYAQKYEAAVARWRRSPERILLGLWGGNLSIRRDRVLQTPIARADTPLGYHMDLEFGLRCWKAGLVGVFDPTLRAFHHYERTVAQFLRDRAVSAVDRSVIHRLHEDILGPLPEDYFRVDASPLARILLRESQSSSVSMLVEAALGRIIAIAGVLKAERTEERAADLLERMQGQRLVIDPSLPPAS